MLYITLYYVISKSPNNYINLKGRDVALRVIRRSEILLSFIQDVITMPHNRCRPLNKTRVKTNIDNISRSKRWGKKKKMHE